MPRRCRTTLPSPAFHLLRSPTRRTARQACLTLGVALASAAVPSPAAARVEFRSSTCNGAYDNADIESLSLTRPPGTVAGDAMVVSIANWQPETVVGAPGGWTKVQEFFSLNGKGTATFVKIAGTPGSDPGPYAFTQQDADSSIGSIASFTGVNTTTPVAPGAGSVQQAGSGSPWTLPNATGTRWGAMRYSAVGSDGTTGADFQANLTEICDRSETVNALATAYEPVDAGTTPNRTVSRASGSATIGHTLVLQPAGACGGGPLSLTEPAAFAFPPTTLTGYDQTALGSATVRVDDQRGTGAGWNVSATSTTFTNGVHTLPTDATTVTSVLPTPVAGACAAPTSGVAHPLTLPAGAPAPSAVKLFNAAADTGLGAVDLAMNAQLRIPGRTRVGTYASTWTFTLATGP